MRQYQLDEEAGKEPDPLEYSREFRNFWKAETNAAYERGRRAVLRKEPVQRHNHVTRDIKPYGQCPACDATEQTGGELAACLEVRAYWRNVAIRELTEAIRFTVEYVGNDMLPAIEGWDWYDALVKYAPEVAQAFVDKPIHFPKQTEAATAAEVFRDMGIKHKAERDAALAAIERVKETLSLHNPNGRLVKEVLAALDGAPEPEEVEWEYGVRNRLTWKVGFPYSREEVADRIDDENRRVAGTYYVMRFEAVRRRKAGPWLPVEGESND